MQSWIICDGDIDPEWIESLNSVLDDNRLLTMPSGERIQFSPNVNFLFETHDLSCASPATISRMGMIFLRYECSTTQSCIPDYYAVGWMGNMVEIICHFYFNFLSTAGKISHPPSQNPIHCLQLVVNFLSIFVHANN